MHCKRPRVLAEDTRGVSEEGKRHGKHKIETGKVILQRERYSNAWKASSVKVAQTHTILTISNKNNIMNHAPLLFW